MNAPTIREQVENKIFELLEQHPEGLNWTDLAKMVQVPDNRFHPKTVNGIIWKIPNKYPDQIYKPAKGIFRLIKYR